MAAPSAALQAPSEWVAAFAERTGGGDRPWAPPAGVNRLLEDLARPGAGEPWLVGGCVRDALLGREPKDLDVVMVGATEDGLLGALPLQKVGKSFPVFGYMDPDLGRIEIALPRRETKVAPGHTGFDCEVVQDLQEDLLRRDLTINAVAWNPHKGFQWPTPEGPRDFDSRTLRHVSPAFGEDPLRVFRLARFAAQLGPEWQVAPETVALVKGMAGTLRELPKDRIREELAKALASSFPSRFFEVLREVDALEHWFPEVQALIGVDHGVTHHPEGDAWAHTLMVLDRARQPDLDCSPVEMLAALGHDFGKALIDPALYPKMHGHADLAEAPIKAFCARLGIGAEPEMIKVARHHHSLHRFDEVRGGTAAELVRTFRRGRLGPEGFARVCQADAQGRGGGCAEEPYSTAPLFLQVEKALGELDFSDCQGDPNRIHQRQAETAARIMKAARRNTGGAE